jgi:hypothetical protein
MTSRDHNRLLGIFFLINGGLSVFGGLVALLVYGGMGTFMLANAREPEAQTVGGVFMVIGIVAGVLISVFAIFFLLAGWKMYKEVPSGRVFGIIGSIICLPSPPLGTALGIYGLWFLLGDQGKAFYEGGGPLAHNPPPPPNSWQ